jgi:hypothetical protein
MYKVLFDHIPKCCGSSLTELLRSAYGVDRVAPPTMGEQALVAKKLFKRYDVVTGHLGGIIFDGWPCEFKAITLIRDPIDRALSTYFYFQTLPRLSIPQVEAVRAMPLEHFVHSRLPLVNEILNNPLTRHFAAATGYAGDYDHEAAVWRAGVAGFASYAYVGVCEAFGPSMKGIFGALAMPAPDVDYRAYRLNRNDHRPARGDIPRHIIEAIAARSCHDLVFYEAALAHVNESHMPMLHESACSLKEPRGNCVLLHVEFEPGNAEVASVKTGESIVVRLRFRLRNPVKGWSYVVQIRNLADEIVFGWNSADDSAGVDLGAGDYELPLRLDVMLKHGQYCFAVAFSSSDDGAFGSIPRWAALIPAKTFRVLGNTGASFYGACKMPITAQPIKRV